MTPPHHQVILDRSIELQNGSDPDYKSVGVHYLASLDLGSASKAVHALRNLETLAWAKAEHCLMRDVGRLLSGDMVLLNRWSALPVSEDPRQLQTRTQLLTFLTRIVLGSFESSATDLEPATKWLAN